jgi:hypothetical protein
MIKINAGRKQGTLHYDMDTSLCVCMCVSTVCCTHFTVLLNGHNHTLCASGLKGFGLRGNV